MRSNSALIFILGCMTALSPFSIDMYLPAFPELAQAFDTTVARVSLSLTGYFIGLALGQLVYGPLLDRFGRKPPLYVGFLIYILASLGCVASGSIESFVVLRVMQAAGGCAAGVAAMAIVRDRFPPQESAKVFSLLILILGASPLLAPTVGGYMTTAFGWESVFLALAGIGSALFVTVLVALPETHTPDPTVSLKPLPTLRNFLSILENPYFATYTLSGAVAFSGLFAYLAGSPVIFMKVFQVSAQVYGWIFALISVGLIGASQLNVVALKRWSNVKILTTAYFAQALTGILFAVGTYLNWYGLEMTILFFFVFLSCLGFTNPNAASLSLAPFARNAGSAAALMGFLQIGLGAVTSMMIGILSVQESFPVAVILSGTSLLALAILLFGQSRIRAAAAGPV